MELRNRGKKYNKQEKHTSFFKIESLDSFLVLNNSFHSSFTELFFNRVET